MIKIVIIIPLSIKLPIMGCQLCAFAAFSINDLKTVGRTINSRTASPIPRKTEKPIIISFGLILVDFFANRSSNFEGSANSPNTSAERIINAVPANI